MGEEGKGCAYSQMLWGAGWKKARFSLSEERSKGVSQGGVEENEPTPDAEIP
jgi:hypothetical protein